MRSAANLTDKARQTTGLDDFGSDDYSEPLDRLVHALNTEAQLNETGAFHAERSVGSGLRNRLLIEDYVRQHPDVLEQEINRPLFIVGLPRTGTTALHHMLNADPANRTLRLWEGHKPVPPPEEATYTTDPRIEKARQGVELTEEIMPGFLKAHLLDAEAPDECHLLFNRNFMSVEYTALYHIPGYANWLYEADLDASYAYHKRQMQLLQYKKSGTWVLKSPFHQLGLPAILKHHPNAIIVQTHRAPMTFVASGCSFVSIVRQGGSDRVDPFAIGQDWMAMLKAYTRSFEANRARLEPDHPGQFIDIDHDDFVHDPWPDLEKIYVAGGRELSQDGRQSIQKWLDENPKGKHGKHHYRLDDYGITAAEVERVFGDYVARYGLSMGA